MHFIGKLHNQARSKCNNREKRTELGLSQLGQDEHPDEEQGQQGEAMRKDGGGVRANSTCLRLKSTSMIWVR